MKSNAFPAEPQTVTALPPGRFDALVERARVLRSAAESGSTQPWLRGKRYGLLCGTEELAGDAAALLDRAAVELGAQVAHIRPHLTEHSAAREVQQTARMLGRLYDAVICEGIAPAVVQQLGAEAGVPVFDHIWSPSHPIAQAAEMLGSVPSPEDNRRFVLQAFLLEASV
jgi:ornithine carbamoyltransferase